MAGANEACQIWWREQRGEPTPAGHNSDPYNYGDRIDALVTQLQLERDERRRLEALAELSTHATDPRAMLAVNQAASNGSYEVRTAANDLLTPKPASYDMPNWQKYGLLGAALVVGVWAIKDLKK